jgi:WD40 repeat protein
VAFSSDGLLASGSGDQTVRVWDPATGQCKHELKGHSDWVGTVAFSSDGLLASGSSDQTVRVWDPATGQCKHELKGHSDRVWTVAFSSDGLLASGSGDQTVRVWDPATGQCKHELKGHSDWVGTVAFSSDGLLASGSDDQTVRVWDPATGQCKHELKDLTLISQGQHSFLSDCKPPFYSLNGERTWVTQNNRGILYLPDYYYRSRAFAVKGNIMALGYGDGRLIFLKFSQAMNL